MEGPRPARPGLLRRAAASAAGWTVTIIGLLILGLVAREFGVNVPWMDTARRGDPESVTDQLLPRLPSLSRTADSAGDEVTLEEYLEFLHQTPERNGFKFTEYGEFIVAFHEREYAANHSRAVDIDSARWLLSSAYSSLREMKVALGEPAPTFEGIVADSLVDLRARQGRPDHTKDDAIAELHDAASAQGVEPDVGLILPVTISESATD